MTTNGEGKNDTTPRDGRAEKPEFPAFPAALSLVALVSPTQALDSLISRRSVLQSRRDASAQETADAIAMGLPHLFLLDDEYRTAMFNAEIAWLDGVIRELESGQLTWSQEWIEQIAARFEHGG